MLLSSCFASFFLPRALEGLLKAYRAGWNIPRSRDADPAFADLKEAEKRQVPFRRLNGKLPRCQDTDPLCDLIGSASALLLADWAGSDVRRGCREAFSCFLRNSMCSAMCWLSASMNSTESRKAWMGSEQLFAWMFTFAGRGNF